MENNQSNQFESEVQILLEEGFNSAKGKSAHKYLIMHNAYFANDTMEDGIRITQSKGGMARYSAKDSLTYLLKDSNKNGKKYFYGTDRRPIDISAFSAEEAEIILAVGTGLTKSSVDQYGFEKVVKVALDSKLPDPIRDLFMEKFAKCGMIRDPLSNAKLKKFPKNEQVKLIDPADSDRCVYMMKLTNGSFISGEKFMDEKAFEKAYKSAIKPPKKLGLWERLADWWHRKEGGTLRGKQYRQQKDRYDRKLYQAKTDAGFAAEKTANVKAWEKKTLLQAAASAMSAEKITLSDAECEALMKEEKINAYLDRCMEGQVFLNEEVKTHLTTTLTGMRDKKTGEAAKKPNGKERLEDARKTRESMHIQKEKPEHTVYQRPEEPAPAKGEIAQGFNKEN